MEPKNQRLVTEATLDARTGSELYSDFRDLPDGPVPTAFTTGQAVTVAATTPVITGGAFTTPATTSARTATYLEASLRSQVTRVGAEFIIRRASPGQADGALALGAWSDPGVVASYPNGYPVAGAHFVITRTGWTYNFYGHTDSTNVAGGTFPVPLAEEVAHRVELTFHGPRVVVALPNGTTTSFSDPRAEQYVDARPFWEPFMETGDQRTNVGITQVWADSRSAETEATRYVTRGQLAAATAARPPAVAAVQWKPTPDQYINLPDSTAPAVVNPNLHLDVQIPDSKQFLITASAAYEKPGASVPYWMFTANTSVTVGIVRLSPITGTETITSQLLVDLSANGSFKPGNTIRIGWSHYKSGADRITLQTGNGRYPTLTVTPITARVVTATA